MYLLSVILLCLFASVLLLPTKTEQKVLKQVVIFSRHGIRTPLGKNLEQVTPKKWPVWQEERGYLTKKGALLEGIMAKYFSDWLRHVKLLPEGCPEEKDVFIYANVKQRTKVSAKSFVDNAFPQCNITIHESDNETDSIFNPVIHNQSTIFHQLALEQMNHKLKSLKMNNAYEELSNILDYEQSEICLVEKKCNLAMDSNKIVDVEAGYKPNINGPLKVSNTVVDAFIMENYEGLQKVAWNELTDEKWQKIMRLSRGYHDVIFNTTLIAKDVSESLLEYLKNIFLRDNTTKFTLLMGHDANIYTLLNRMYFKVYFLPNQYEITPVSGKIVFQKWYSEERNVDLLRINYIYQSTDQLRKSTKLSLRKPPQVINLQLKYCPVDQEGFCLWDDFVKFLNSL